MELIPDEIPSMRFVLNPEQTVLVKEKTRGGRVRVGFRPQAVLINRDGKKSEGSFIGKVYAYNPFVTYGIMIIEVDGTRIRVLTRANEHFEVDQEVSVRIESKDIYLFEESTTTNLIYV